MKLLFCPECDDVFKLDYNLRTCECGKTKGKYNDDANAVTNGKGVCMAIGNGSLKEAARKLMEFSSESNRDFYKNNCRVEYCWVRPHEGRGNPHTKEDENL